MVQPARPKKLRLVVERGGFCGHEPLSESPIIVVWRGTGNETIERDLLMNLGQIEG